MTAPDTLPLDAHLCFSIYAANQAFARLYRPVLDPLGLTYPQYLVMVVLWETDGTTVGRIGDKLDLDSGTLTPLLKRLEARGVVTRRRSTDDARVVNIHLTAAGIALKAQARTIPAQIACATGLELSDITRLRGAMRRLARDLNAAAATQGLEPAFPQE